MSELSQNGDDASLVMGDGLDDNDKEPKKKVKQSAQQRPKYAGKTPDTIRASN